MAEIKNKMDVRTYSRYVEKGLLKDSEIQSQLKALPDETDNAVWVDLTVEEEETLADEGDSGATSSETVTDTSTPTTVEGT